MSDQPLVLGHSADFLMDARAQALADSGLRLQLVGALDDQLPRQIQLLLLDERLLELAPLSYWQEQPYALLSFTVKDAEILPLPQQASAPELRALLEFAAEQGRLQQITVQLASALQTQGQDLHQLVDVGLALSAERDLDRLLEKILEEGRRLSGSDAASLFLVERKNGEPQQLVFKLAQNATLGHSGLQNQRMPLSKASIVGYVALTCEELNISDAYAIEPGAPYRFNRSFDLQMGYRTLSILAIPMLNHRSEVVGVLEFINRQRPGRGDEPPRAIAFDQYIATMLRALASQAAVAIENRQLLNEISQLFDGFVQASVFAIEQRDPTTSGHSFRVAELCLALAGLLPQAPVARLREQSFSANALRELRFAALLHDFGKVGVREHVLTKARKLPDLVLENLRYKVALAKENLTNHSLRKMLQISQRPGGLSEHTRLELETELACECARLDGYLANILSANEPNMLLGDLDLNNLQEIQGELVKTYDSHLASLLSEGEFCALAVRRGSLTAEERAEIERHVVHTREFLNLIPWTPDLAQVPSIAGAHHEKLDGSGYPHGLQAERIPFGSKIMTICDIFDALTASDRPYKPAMPAERALDVLHDEAQKGLLDSDLVQLFSDSRCFAPVLTTRQSALAALPKGPARFCHHPCDHEPGCGH